jgi:LemA protein
MKAALIGLGGLILVIVLILMAVIPAYNGMVDQDEKVTQSWADVETQYQRRADLIPNLVNTVKGAADFEKETLDAVISARARATSINLSPGDLSDPSKIKSFMSAQNSLSGALGRLLVVSENYPQLRATESFQQLQDQLEGTENRINVARRDYNNAVRNYNTTIRRFPGSLVASLTGFERRTPFEAQAGAEKAPQVDFN